MPRPSEVPRSGSSRSMAARTRAWSLVGTWIEKPLSLKATTPISIVAGWRSTNPRAAALAASIRVGARSSAAMLPETSNERMTVPSTRGTLTTLCGRATARTRIVRPATNSAAGSRRRRRPLGAGARAAAPAAPPAPTSVPELGDPASAPAVADEVERHPERDRQREEQHRRPEEGHG